MNNKSVEEEIDREVEKSGLSRLEVISNMDLGERSEAAKRVLYKRSRRKELMGYGFSLEIARIIINNE